MASQEKIRILRLEDLQPIRAPEALPPDELVIVVKEGEVVIAELVELLAA